MEGSAFRLWVEEEGQGLVEYALIFTLIVLVAIISMGSVAVSVSHDYSEAANKMTSVRAPASWSGDHVEGSPGADSTQSGWSVTNPVQNNVANNVARSGSE